MRQEQPDPRIPDEQLQMINDLYFDWVQTKYELIELQKLITPPMRFHNLLEIGHGPILLMGSCILQSVTMSLCRMTDKAKQGKSENISLPQLHPLQDDERLPRLSILIDDAIASAAFCRDVRNKFLAHRDRASNDYFSRNLLSTLDVDEISTCLDKIFRFHRYLRLQLWESDIANDVIVKDDMLSLAAMIAKGHHFEKSHKEARDWKGMEEARAYVKEILCL